MSLTSTPSANRLHIGIFGKRNSGKSSLINAITGQNTAVTSDIAGTTTDPVYKAMEIHGIGPRDLSARCVLKKRATRSQRRMSPSCCSVMPT